MEKGEVNFGFGKIYQSFQFITTSLQVCDFLRKSHHTHPSFVAELKALLK